MSGSSYAVESGPPRKRQRTMERDPSGPARSKRSSIGHATSVVPEETGTEAGPSSNRGGTGPGDSNPHETDPEHVFQGRMHQPPARYNDPHGTAEGSKGGPSPTGKGKARAATAITTNEPETQPDGPTTAMLHVASPRAADRDRNDGSRHAASGARAKAMGIDHSGLARAAGPEDREPTRDAEYYIVGADCVIRVENTLFRVHRYFLGRDDSAFQDMFNMPGEGGVPSQVPEGCSDDNPIHLYGESVERFRDLLSVVYALPSQLQAYHTPAADTDRLVTICEMTNKYHFTSTESWAIDALFNVISGLHGPPQQQYDPAHCSSAWMKRLLAVAILCSHERLTELVARKWVDRILARDLRPVHALDIAACSGNERLAGYAYYVQLLEMGPDFDAGVVEDGKQYARARLGGTPTAAALTTAATPGASSDSIAAEPRLGTPATLTREQKQRLLSGHWSLTRLWEKLRTTPPTFERPEGCVYHQHGCVPTWAAVWREVGKSEATLEHPEAAVLARLKAMDGQLLMHPDLSCALSPQCKRAALQALKAMVIEVKHGLAGHFFDLTADAHPPRDSD